MRTLSGTLTTAQQGTGQTPFVKVVLTSPDTLTTYTFKTTDATNRVWRVDSPENVWGGSDRTYLYLQNSDQNFSALDLRGYKADIYWGYVTGAGEESSQQAPVWVYDQQDHSEEGILMTKLECVDIWWRLSKLKVVGGGTKLNGTIAGTFQHGELVTGGTTGVTARVLVVGTGHIVVVGADGTFVAPEVVTGGSSGATITLSGVTAGGVGASPSWNSDTTILNILRSLTYQVADLVDDTAGADARINDTPEYVANRFDSMLGIIRRMVEMTNSQLLFKNDGDLHLVYLNPAPATDYSYDGTHSFIVDVRSRTLTVPNKVFVVDQLPDSEEVEGDPQYTYFGVANDATSQAAIGIITQVVEAPGITSDVEAANRAAALLLRIQEETTKGYVKAPMNCGEEIADWISITDTRLNVTVAGRVAKIIRSYVPREQRDGHYTIEINVGGLLEAVDISTPQSLLDSLIIYGYGRYSIPGGAISGPISGGGAIVDAEVVTYTPAVLADWDASADPGDTDDALDQLAERTTDLELIDHDAVTLAADADVLLGLTTQQLTLDAQAANAIFAGPTTGGNADPTFRAMVEADIADEIVTSRKLAPTVVEQRCTANTTISAVGPTDITGATITLTPAIASMALVIAAFSVGGTVAGDVFSLLLDVDGATEAAFARYETSVAGSDTKTQAQVWIVPLTAAAHTLKLQASRTSGTGSLTVYNTHTKLVVVLIGDANVTNDASS